MACFTDEVRARPLLYVALMAAGVMAAGTGLLVALRYVEQPGPFGEGALGAAGGAMASAGFYRWRKHRSSGSGQA